MTDGWDEREVGDLSDEYELLEELGRGASAVVYRARDRTLGRDVAIKVVRPHSIASADDALQRLAREARTVARLHHPNIVTVHAVKRLPASGGLALVMQLVPGRTLKATLAAEGPMAPERAEQILRDVAGALAYANAHGVVHRDVKPENIFLDAETGRAMLSDFGIAYSVDHESRLTMTGAAIGTPAYMAPEQIDGAPADARSDLYSLGIVAWEMLTGERPWGGESLFNVILKQKTEELPAIDALRPGVVPERLQYLVERMLQKRPGARWAGAEGLLAKLDRWVVPSDWPQWQAAHRRRREQARQQAASSVARSAPVSPSEVATVVFRRDGAAQDAAVQQTVKAGTAATTPTDVAAHSVARLLPTAPPRNTRSTVRDMEEQAPSWALEPALASPGRWRWLAGAAGVGLLVVLGAALRGDGGQATELSATQGQALVATADSATVDSAAADSVTGDSVRGDSLPAGSPTIDASSRLAVNDNASPRPSPTPAPAPAPVSVPASLVRAPVIPVPVAVGRGHSCAIREGRLFCWGANEQGQLGGRSTSAASRTPVAVPGATAFRAVTAGAQHTCALDARGLVLCWGANDHEQLGSASGSSALQLRQVELQDVSAVAAGDAHTCALSATGAVTCWGANDVGQLGSAGRGGRLAAVTVGDSTRFVALASGGRHSCAIDAVGGVWCWGANREGQLGVGTGDQAGPVRLASGDRFMTIAAGGAHTCAVSGRGETWCWGRNDEGQLGVSGRRAGSRPRRVAGAPPFLRLALGEAHSCGLTADGEAWCWGANRTGQLGDGTTDGRARPVRVAGGPFVALSAAIAHSCGTYADGAVSCWGANAQWQLSDGRRNPVATPVRVTIP